MKKKHAFTMAEVLIAMTIIGIVSALIIPVFLANSTGKQRRISFIKGLNSLSRAATANYGTDGYDFSGTNGYYGTVEAPVETYNVPGGAADGPIIGFNTQSIPGNNTFSDLHPDTPSLFHLWINNLNLKSSSELTNYAVSPADITLNCASRNHVSSVQVKIDGLLEMPDVEIKSELGSRAYWNLNIMQGSGSIAPLCEGRTLEDGGFNQGRMFMLEDGMVFTYDPAQAYCFESNPCYGYIDINGPEGPNRVISCSEGEDSFITTYGRNAVPGMLFADCTVNTSDISDIYPVLFYNNVVKPASWAAKSVFNLAVSNQITGEEIANSRQKH